jgi:UDP-glucose 4-epimerase
VFDVADVVVHLACGFQPARDTRYLTRLGVGGTSAVLQAAHSSGIGHLIHMSSVGTYAAGSYGARVNESWPTTGIASSPYSRDKSAAEAVLDEYEQRLGSAAIPIARMRPGFILQRVAASGLMRYGLPGYVPMWLIPRLPVLPLDKHLCIPLIHADDVADAITRVIDRRAAGPFNLAAEPPVGRDDVAAALGAHPVHVPSGVLRALVDLTWRARLQHIDRGWLDLAFTAAGLLTCPQRARLDAEMDLEGRPGRPRGWRRASRARRQPTSAATLDARPAAPRCDRGPDFVAPAAMSAHPSLWHPRIGVPSGGVRRDR